MNGNRVEQFNSAFSIERVPVLTKTTTVRLVDCRDAESGDSVWMVRVGDRRLGYLKMGINEDFLSVINGANLLKLDVKTGEQMQAVRTTNTPAFGAVHAEGWSLIPTIRSGVEGYPLDDPSRVPFMEMVEGTALAEQCVLS